jgi:glucose/arabinose dehydrogenase
MSAPVAQAQPQLTTVASGLSAPLFVGHAGDGSNRLFIVEQAGVIKVLAPGSSTPSVFLDIRSRVNCCGERGLLGLAFHPQYPTNGRFFVFYTRGDGALTIAEYSVSANPNVANTAEALLLTIPHADFGNHNGGMIAFAPDGYLYIGTGDGGGGNDPFQAGQDTNTLLGKILRINVSTPGAYSNPADNPFVNAPGLDEIFAFGLRNPWRFSFDRITGQMWVGDVGQNAREEVNTPIVRGGNYGWRIFEGFQCTGLGPPACNAAAYLPPVIDYAHSAGRCSITGGYVYRGTVGALPNGTYVYGDLCTGEIFTWNGTAQSLLFDTPMSISSFGEDEQGELYVVNHSGTVSRFAASAPCTYSVSPENRTFSSGGGSGTVAVTSTSGCAWAAISSAPWLRVTSGATGSGNGNVGFTADANPSADTRTARLTIGGQTFTVTQTGVGACEYSLGTVRATFGRTGGRAKVSVTAGEGCTWTAASDVPWIAITGGTSGSGNGTISYIVGRNTVSGGRNGAITVAGLPFVVQQPR